MEFKVTTMTMMRGERGGKQNPSRKQYGWWPRCPWHPLRLPWAPLAHSDPVRNLPNWRLYARCSLKFFKSFTAGLWRILEMYINSLFTYVQIPPISHFVLIILIHLRTFGALDLFHEKFCRYATNLGDVGEIWYHLVLCLFSHSTNITFCFRSLKCFVSLWRVMEMHMYLPKS